MECRNITSDVGCNYSNNFNHTKPKHVSKSMRVYFVQYGICVLCCWLLAICLTACSKGAHWPDPGEKMHTVVFKKNKKLSKSSSVFGAAFDYSC